MAYESNVANDVLVTPFDNKAVAFRRSKSETDTGRILRKMLL